VLCSNRWRESLEEGTDRFPHGTGEGQCLRVDWVGRRKAQEPDVGDPPGSPRPLVRGAPGAAEMTKQEIVLTPEGLKKLTAELEELKSVARKRVAEQIREAKQFGEIGENSAYEEAKAAQAQIEGRIEALQYILQNAVIVEGRGSDGKVAVGSVVRLQDVGSGEETEYHIVGALEADPAEHRISNQSPLGEALIGHSAGETVEVRTPGGLRSYVILSVGE